MEELELGELFAIVVAGVVVARKDTMVLALHIYITRLRHTFAGVATPCDLIALGQILSTAHPRVYTIFYRDLRSFLSRTDINDWCAVRDIPRQATPNPNRSSLPGFVLPSLFKNAHSI